MDIDNLHLYGASELLEAHKRYEGRGRGLAVAADTVPSVGTEARRCLAAAAAIERQLRALGYTRKSAFGAWVAPGA